MARQRSPIPRYGLYGEDTAEVYDELIHCETIAARSGPAEWEIAAHRHPALWQVLFVASGDVRVLLEGTRHDEAGPVIVTAPAGSIHGFRFSEGTVGFVLTLAREFLSRLPAGDPLGERLAMASVQRVDRAMKRRLLVLGRQLVDARPEPPGAHHGLLQRALAEAWLRSAAELLPMPGIAPADARLRRFEALVERDFRSHRPLEDYARELGCTVRTLARLTRESRAMTPAQFINRRIAIEARRLLRFTNAGCGEVAAELGFDDPSYFSRFYLRETGRRPSGEKAMPPPHRHSTANQRSIRSGSDPARSRT